MDVLDKTETSETYATLSNEAENHPAELDFLSPNVGPDQVREWFNQITQTKDYKFTMFVSYRGRWCAYCRHYVRDLKEAQTEIAALGGQVVLFCAQEPRAVERTNHLWALTFEYLISDPENKLAKFLKAEKLADPIITGDGGDEGYNSGAALTFARNRGYKHGIVQPCILIVDSNGKRLFHWESPVNSQNGMGSSGRPDPEVIIELIRRKLDGRIPRDEVNTITELHEYIRVHYLRLWNPEVLFFMARRFCCYCCITLPEYQKNY